MPRSTTISPPSVICKIAIITNSTAPPLSPSGVALALPDATAGLRKRRLARIHLTAPMVRLIQHISTEWRHFSDFTFPNHAKFKLPMVRNLDSCIVYRFWIKTSNLAWYGKEFGWQCHERVWCDLKRRVKGRVVDLFAGAGGFSLAAQNLGCNVVFAVENDPHAAATYKHNVCGTANGSETALYTEDIRLLDPSDLAKVHFGNTDGCDLLLGGPPCQGFSTHRINSAGVGDPRNALIYSYFNFVHALQPRAFLMENVPGILWPRHAEYLEKFYALARDAGYTTFMPLVLDARDYGVPQRRKRVFVLGVHAAVPVVGLRWPPPKSHSASDTSGVLPTWVSCEQAFRPTLEADPNDQHMNHGIALTEAFKRTPKNGGSRKDSGRVLPCHTEHDGHKDVYGRIDQRLPAPTMTTACINPSKGRFVHPFENHGITVRHAARIQTFPDNFIFSGGLIAAGKQIGNAVPVMLGEVLISEIISAIVPSREPSPLTHQLENA